MEIKEILDRNGSDKCIDHSYGFFYHELFSTLDRNAPLDILEIGVESGASLAAWREYFPNARITGIDIKDSRKEEFKTIDAEFILTDVRNFVPTREYDLVIDDGSHLLGDSFWILATYVPWIKEGGNLIIEDIQNAERLYYWAMAGLPLGFSLSLTNLQPIHNRYDDLILRIQRYREDWKGQSVKAKAQK